MKTVLTLFFFAFHFLNAQTAFVSNENGVSLTPIDISTNTPEADIPLPSIPAAIAITPDGTVAIVVSSFDDNAMFVSTATRSVIKTILVGTLPTDVAIAPNGLTAYVTNAADNNVILIDLTTNTTGATIPVGSSPQGIAITPDGTTAYVVNQNSDNVTPIDLATNTPGASIAVGANPSNIAISPDGSIAYITSGDGISVINLATNTPETPIASPSSSGLAFTNDSSTAYVGRTSDVVPIDVATSTLGTPIPFVGFIASAIAISPDNSTAYCTILLNSKVVPIDIATNTLGADIPVGTTPSDIAITPFLSAVSGKCVKDEYPTQTDIANVISWTEPSISFVRFLIYRDDDLTDLVGIIPNNKFQFIDHQRSFGSNNKYVVVGENAQGLLSILGKIVINCS